MTPWREFGRWSPDPVRRRKAARELAALIIGYAVGFIAITEAIGYTLGLTAAKVWLVLAGAVQVGIAFRLVFGERK